MPSAAVFKQLLSHVLAGFAPVDPASDRVILGLALDSRCVRPGDLFFACPGRRSNGRAFIPQALQAGAVAIAWDTGQEGAAVSDRLAKEVPLIGVTDLTSKIGLIADRFYDHPSRDLFVVGITGTDGKTSCSHFLAQCLTTCGIIGTLGHGVYPNMCVDTHTTPDAVTIHRLLAEMRNQGVRQVVMEVSSHGLEQGRVSGVSFDLALLTNLTRDHLDYHGTREAYAQAKRRLFETPGLRYAVLNRDDPFGRELLSVLAPEVKRLTFGLVSDAQAIDGERDSAVLGSELHLYATGLSMQVHAPHGQGEIKSGLLGRFNAANLLAVLCLLLLMDVPFPEALDRLQRIRTVPGRMERFGGRDQPLVVVDYAHTPDALEHVLRALRAHCSGQLWCMFGCGGDRDRGKRPLMGAVTERLADYVVLTNDNPRHEHPGRIIADIQAGLTYPSAVRVEPQRAHAIRYAIEHAQPGDVVLIAGKGHETYQLIGDQKQPFSDRAQVLAALGKEHAWTA
jgi:UDP-N-acetylmuramyl-tripeptide synthetase